MAADRPTDRPSDRPSGRPSARRAGVTVATSRSRLRRWWRVRVLAHRRALAFCCAAAAVAAGMHATAPPAPPSEHVLVAAHDLPAGTVLEPGDLSRAAYAEGTRPDGLAVAPVGRTLAAPLRRGEPVTDLRLVTPGLLEGYPGLVAVPVRIPDPGAVALLRVGDEVDVVASDPERAEAEVVAGDAPVLALPRDDDTATGQGVTGRLVVLGVPPHEAGALTVAAVRAFLMVTLSR